MACSGRAAHFPQALRPLHSTSAALFKWDSAWQASSCGRGDHGESHRRPSDSLKRHRRAEANRALRKWRFVELEADDQAQVVRGLGVGGGGTRKAPLKRSGSPPSDRSWSHRLEDELRLFVARWKGIYGQRAEAEANASWRQQTEGRGAHSSGQENRSSSSQGQQGQRESSQGWHSSHGFHGGSRAEEGEGGSGSHGSEFRSSGREGRGQQDSSSHGHGGQQGRDSHGFRHGYHHESGNRSTEQEQDRLRHEKQSWGERGDRQYSAGSQGGAGWKKGTNQSRGRGYGGGWRQSQERERARWQRGREEGEEAGGDHSSSGNRRERSQRCNEEETTGSGSWGGSGSGNGSGGEPCPRQLLGLPSTGALSAIRIKHAFRKCALMWHPDRHCGPGKVVAEAKFKAALAAYETLLAAT